MKPEVLQGVERNFDHPAKFNERIMETVQHVLDRRAVVNAWDPFGGIGGIHMLDDIETYCTELEPEWAAAAATKGWSGARDFLAPGMHDEPLHLLREYEGRPQYKTVGLGSIEAIVTSPTYGNRMADKHEAKDDSKRLTYKHRLGRDLSLNNSGGMQWGLDYKVFHRQAWKRAAEVLRPGALLVVNVKNHIRAGEEMDVVGWHQAAIARSGFDILETHKVPVTGMGFGQHQHTAKVDHEIVLVYERTQER